MPPVVLTTDSLAALLDTSTRTVQRLDSAGRIPAPIRLGGRPRWLRAEIDAWLAAGAPDRERWAEIRRLEREGE